jgi:acylglycerol lipase
MPFVKTVFGRGVLIAVAFLCACSARAQNFLPAQPVIHIEPASSELPAALQPLLAAVTDPHGYLSAADGTCLFYRDWFPANSPEPAAIVLVLHGIGYHGGPYKFIAEDLNPLGVAVYALDARGHGLSCGARDTLPPSDVENHDIGAMLDLIRASYPGAKIFLLGDSMGGVMAMDYAREHNSGLAGLILVVPAISVPFFGQLDNKRNLPLLPYAIFDHSAPVVSLVGHRLTQSSRDPQFIAERRSDPLAYKKVSISYVVAAGRAARHWDTETAPRITLPVLLLEGQKDPIVSHAASRKLFKSLGSDDKTFEAFSGARHTILWDPDSGAVLATINRWLADH